MVRFRTTQVHVAGVILLWTTLLTGCELVSTEPSGRAREAPSFSPEVRTVVEGSNRFGIDLFRTLNQGNRSEDPRIQLISPPGIAASLAMLMEGARGETRDRIRVVLHIPDEQDRQTLDVFTRLFSYLGETDPDHFYESLQALIIPRGLRLTESYPRIPNRLVGARLQEFSYYHPEAIPILNEWIERETRGRSHRLIDQLSPQDLLVMMNAAYAVGTWRYRFDRARSGPRPFTRFDGAEVEVPFMVQDGIYPYAETDSVRIASIPYGDSLFAMHAVLPAHGGSVHGLIQRLDVERWSRWMRQLEPRYLELAVPRIYLGYRETLNNELSGHGVAAMFSTARADFSGIGPDNIAVSRFRHESVLGRLGERGIGPPRRPSGDVDARSFSLDRPFLLAVTERHTGMILFIGRVAGRPPEPTSPDRGALPAPDEVN